MFGSTLETPLPFEQRQLLFVDVLDNQRAMYPLSKANWNPRDFSPQALRRGETGAAKDQPGACGRPAY